MGHIIELRHGGELPAHHSIVMVGSWSNNGGHSAAGVSPWGMSSPLTVQDWPSPSLHSLNELWTQRVPDTQSAEGGQSMISAQVSAPIF